MSKSLTSSSLIGLGFSKNLLCNNGLASPNIDFFGTTFSVWVLSSDVLPQPANVFGIWVDAESWSDSNVYYS